MASDKINPRKFRIWDTAILHEAMTDAVEIKHQLESICIKEDTPINEIKPTLINSRMLYVLASSYVESYEKLIAENLLHIGSKIDKLKPTIH